MLIWRVVQIFRLIFVGNGGIIIEFRHLNGDILCLVKIVGVILMDRGPVVVLNVQIAVGVRLLAVLK